MDNRQTTLISTRPSPRAIPAAINPQPTRLCMPPSHPPPPQAGVTAIEPQPTRPPPTILPCPPSLRRAGKGAIVPIEPRSASNTACNRCRSRKVKCDGQRPTCNRCATSNLSCGYATKEGETPASARKRRYSDMDRLAAQWRQLYDALRQDSYSDAYALFLSIRESGDPLEILQSLSARRTGSPSSKSDPGLIPPPNRAFMDVAMRPPAVVIPPEAL